jgi:BNR repeat protein/pentapeptide repeat protein
VRPARQYTPANLIPVRRQRLNRQRPATPNQEPAKTGKIDLSAITTVTPVLVSIGALIFTALSLIATRDQIAIAQQGQYTDRYSRAIEQLGQQGPDQLQIRLGGIYALERLAHDSPRDQPTIIEVLTTFVRTSTHPKSLEPSGPSCPDTPPTPDTQAALTVLGRRAVVHDGDAVIKLNNLCLAGANFESANLSKAMLNKTNLQNVNFASAHLEGAQLSQADLTGAQLWKAHLNGAHLDSANLTDAELNDSKLVGADLSWITINGNTNFIGVDLRNARLENAPNIERSVATTTNAPESGRFAPFGLGHSPHAGYPTATRLPSGAVRMMWRQGTSRVGNDGRLYTAVGNPAAGKWSSPSLVQIDVGLDGDVRDPHLSTIGGDVWLTYFVSFTNGIPTGARAARSTDGGATFGPSVRIDPDLPYAAISSPIVKVGGKLMTGFYGRRVGENVDTVWAAWSTDNGQSWASNRIANDIDHGHAYAEPWVVTDGTTAVYLFRDVAKNAIATRSTPDGGVKWSLGPRSVVTNATGNSSSMWSSNGRIYTVYRDTTTHVAMLASSPDGGKTFEVERELMPANSSTSPVGMTYAHPVELDAGRIWCPVGMERSNGEGRLYLGYL